jgi:hypothetical protein
MKHLLLFESWSLKNNSYGKSFYKAKNEGAFGSKGAAPHPFVNQNRDNVIEYKPGDIIMVGSQSGSLGLCSDFHKVEINGDDINFLGKEVTMWTGYKYPTNEEWFKKDFEEINPHKQ